MKRFLLGAALAALTLCSSARAAEEPPAVSAAAAAVMHVETGTVLYEKNADSHMLIASTTKIMTALVVLERCALDEPVEILPEYTAVEGSSMQLRAGETYTVEQLLYGLLLVSGNDAATALACHAAGSIEDFAALMNEKAAALGLTETAFQNPHGLDAPGHYSTARDLARLACCAMQNETFRTIVSTETYRIGDKNYVNHNRLLRSYPGAVGVKTGYTREAGRILVSCAQREGTQFVCVTIADPDDWDDHTRLLDWAFDRYEYRAVDARYALPAVSGAEASCTVVPAGETSLLVERGTAWTLHAELPRYVFAPVAAGDAVGTLTVTTADGQTAALPLVCAQDVPLAENARLTPRERLARVWERAGHYLFSYYPRS